MDSHEQAGDVGERDRRAGEQTPGEQAPGQQAARFPFAFDGPVGRVAPLVGVRPARAWVDVTGDELDVRFGPWRLRTPLENVTGSTITGPYRWWKVIGPAHLSFADHGVTFATNAARGLCIRFHDPVRALTPMGWPRHPAATVTVEDPERLQRLLAARGRARG
jgi:hypothetical protein